MGTVQVGVRLDEKLVEEIDKIASDTGVNRTYVMERCIRMGLKTERELMDIGPVALEVINVLLSDPVRKPLEMLIGRSADKKQLARLKHLRKRRRGEVESRPAVDGELAT